MYKDSTSGWMSQNHTKELIGLVIRDKRFLEDLSPKNF